jgi:hypothetical protein
MIATSNPIEEYITFYVILNAFFCFLTAFWIFWIFLAQRYLFIKPSMLLLTFSHIFFQWPVTIYARYYENFLPDPYAFALLIHAYMIVGLLVTVFTFRLKASMIWDRITDPCLLESAVSIKAVAFTTSLVVCIVIIYLAHVPFKSTGLYAIFMNPSSAAQARENSLKLLDSQALVYAYSLMVSSIAPLLAVMLGILFIRGIAKRFFLKIPIYTLLFFLLAFAVSMTGARISIVNLLIVIAIAFFFHKGLPFKPLKFFLLLFLLLLLPSILSILREGKAIGIGTIFEYLGYLAQRTFIIPLEVGSWFVHYSQINGVFGIAAIHKLAAILGVKWIDTPNLIGLTYATGSPTASVGYLFSYYSYFGLSSIVLSILYLWLLDVALLVYERLSHVMILPCVAAASLSVLYFISSDYTTVWLTHGFGVILLLSCLIDRFIIPSRGVLTFLSAQSSAPSEINVFKQSS